MEKYIAVTKENREFLIKTFRTTKNGGMAGTDFC